MAPPQVLKKPEDLFELLEGDFDPVEARNSLQKFEDNGWTTASLVNAYVTLRQQYRERDAAVRPRTLESMARKKSLTF